MSEGIAVPQKATPGKAWLPNPPEQAGFTTRTPPPPRSAGILVFARARFRIADQAQLPGLALAADFRAGLLSSTALDAGQRQVHCRRVPVFTCHSIHWL